MQPVEPNPLQITGVANPNTPETAMHQGVENYYNIDKNENNTQQNQVIPEE